MYEIQQSRRVWEVVKRCNIGLALRAGRRNFRIAHVGCVTRLYIVLVFGNLLAPSDSLHAEEALRGAAARAGIASFQRLATCRGVGAVLRSLVGPGPTSESERFYQSYSYIGGSLEIVSIDPDTGQHQVYRSPISTESGAWALAAGPDGNIYAGTFYEAHLLRLDPRTGEFKDMGRPSDSEQYIWGLAVGADKKLYGCTYPHAKLVRFDPATGTSEDLGRMDSTEHYARSVVASDDGFVYVGIGTGRANLVAYEIATGERRDILPESLRTTGAAMVHRGDDGRIYAEASGRQFRLEAWNAVPVVANDVRPEATNLLKDGRMIVNAADGAFTVHDSRSNTSTSHSFSYQGQPINVFRLGLGPDRMLYASTCMPLYLMQLDPQGGEPKSLGRLGGGEVYSFLPAGDKLFCAAYVADAPLMSYDPRRSFAPGIEASANPILVTYDGQTPSWRPMAMIAARTTDVYIGALAGYGQLGGPLTVWNPKTSVVESFHHTVEDQSVVSLTEADGVIVGGTTVDGGEGSHPTSQEARLFIWDPVAKRKLFETAPVPGAKCISDLIAAPNGKVYGIAGPKNQFFAFDVEQRQVTHVAESPFDAGIKEPIYNSVGIGPDRRIWGLCRQGVFAVDPDTCVANLVAEAPEPITAGFVLLEHAIYFGSGPSVYRCDLPR